MTDISAIRVPRDFEKEFPGASRSAAEVAANLVRTSNAFVAEIDRPSREMANLSVSAFQTLAILEGAGEPLTARTIAERMLVSSASMTSLLDTLERRGLVERRPHPSDRRKVLIHLTEQAQQVVDQVLPVVHAVISEAVGNIAESQREPLIAALTTMRARLDVLASTPLPSPKGRRKRSASPDSGVGSRPRK
jgi:DNA-binding MarR family transcriptional regulator